MRNPFGVTLAVAQEVLAHAEFLGIVDHGFNPKNESGFVVHLEPVLFNTAFDSRSAGAQTDQAEKIGDDFPFEVAVQFTSKEVHYLLGAKHAVAKKWWIQLAQILTRLEQDVG